MSREFASTRGVEEAAARGGAQYQRDLREPGRDPAAQRGRPAAAVGQCHRLVGRRGGRKDGLRARCGTTRVWRSGSTITARSPAWAPTRCRPPRRSTCPCSPRRGTVGVLGVRPAQPRRFVAPEQLHLLETFASQTALAIERAELADEAQQAQVADRDRAHCATRCSARSRTICARRWPSITGATQQPAGGWRAARRRDSRDELTRHRLR